MTLEQFRLTRQTITPDDLHDNSADFRVAQLFRDWQAGGITAEVPNNQIANLHLYWLGGTCSVDRTPTWTVILERRDHRCWWYDWAFITDTLEVAEELSHKEWCDWQYKEAV